MTSRRLNKSYGWNLLDRRLKVLLEVLFRQEALYPRLFIGWSVIGVVGDSLFFLLLSVPSTIITDHLWST
jgi:hypothetical protein